MKFTFRLHFDKLSPTHGAAAADDVDVVDARRSNDAAAHGLTLHRKS